MVHFKHRPDAILAGYLRTVLTSRQLHPPSEPGTDGHQTSKRLEFPVEATTLCVAGHPDVVLVAEDDHGASRPVWAHQCILWCSSVLRELFSRPEHECRPWVTVVLAGFHYQSVEALVKFIYTGEIELTKKTKTCLEFQALASLLRIDPPVTKIRRDSHQLTKARKGHKEKSHGPDSKAQALERDAVQSEATETSKTTLHSHEDKSKAPSTEKEQNVPVASPKKPTNWVPCEPTDAILSSASTSRPEVSEESTAAPTGQSEPCCGDEKKELERNTKDQAVSDTQKNQQNSSEEKVDTDPSESVTNINLDNKHVGGEIKPTQDPEEEVEHHIVDDQFKGQEPMDFDDGFKMPVDFDIPNDIVRSQAKHARHARYATSNEPASTDIQYGETDFGDPQPVEDAIETGDASLTSHVTLASPNQTSANTVTKVEASKIGTGPKLPNDHNSQGIKPNISVGKTSSAGNSAKSQHSSKEKSSSIKESYTDKKRPSKKATIARVRTSENKEEKSPKDLLGCLFGSDDESEEHVKKVRGQVTPSAETSKTDGLNIAESSKDLIKSKHRSSSTGHRALSVKVSGHSSSSSKESTHQSTKPRDASKLTKNSSSSSFFKPSTSNGDESRKHEEAKESESTRKSQSGLSEKLSPKSSSTSLKEGESSDISHILKSSLSGSKQRISSLPAPPDVLEAKRKRMMNALKRENPALVRPSKKEDIPAHSGAEDKRRRQLMSKRRRRHSPDSRTLSQLSEDEMGDWLVPDDSEEEVLSHRQHHSDSWSARDSSDSDEAEAAPSDERQKDPEPAETRKDRLLKRNEKIGLGWLNRRSKVQVSVQNIGIDVIQELRHYRYSLLAENSSDEDQGDQPKVKQKRIRKAFEDTSSSSTAPPSESEASSSSLMGQRKKKKKRKQDLEHSVSVREASSDVGQPDDLFSPRVILSRSQSVMLPGLKDSAKIKSAAQRTKEKFRDFRKRRKEHLARRKSEAGSSKMEAGTSKMKVGSSKMDVGIGHSKSGKKEFKMGSAHQVKHKPHRTSESKNRPEETMGTLSELFAERGASFQHKYGSSTEAKVKGDDKLSLNPDLKSISFKVKKSKPAEPEEVGSSKILSDTSN